MTVASLICRGKNLTLETVFAFVNAMPKEPMLKTEFNSYAEMRLDGWTQTHSQIARQMALYYNEGDMCIPRFDKFCTKSEVFEYAQKWAKLYFVPNPYTPSLFNFEPKNIYASFRQMIEDGQTSLDEACQRLFETEVNNVDKVRVYLTNFTNIIIDKNHYLSVNEGLIQEEIPLVQPGINNFQDKKEYFDYFGKRLQSHIETVNNEKSSCQIIYYGAPGTGKSYEIKAKIKNNPHVRTTFHPDSDYSSFVGAYKPTMEKTGVVINEKEETKISYNFVPQAFLKAYIAAWNNYPEPEFLIIEEINRGNCAQIFGDLFQLLDRNGQGFSDYPISADEDVKRFIKKKFAKNSVNNRHLIDESKAKINSLFTEEYEDVMSKVLSGELLLLPSNLYIHATMNTSDQSLFPIDSAFKRRWDWQYVPITEGKNSVTGESKGWQIQVNGEKKNWWQFLQAINIKIGSTTDSEDKKLGYFFAKAHCDIISAETFVAKVIFYLWNDVFKDYGFDDDIFLDIDNEPFTFPKFFENCEHEKKVNEIRIAKFIDNVLASNNAKVTISETPIEE